MKCCTPNQTAKIILAEICSKRKMVGKFDLKNESFKQEKELYFFSTFNVTAVT
jgi:hypothetical protein